MMTPRQIVFQLYVLTLLLSLLVVIVGAASALVRQQAFPAAAWLYQVALPRILLAVWQDPHYLLAFALVLPLLWSLPWEALGQNGEIDEDDDPDVADWTRENVRRGRLLQASPRADKKAYQALVDQVVTRPKRRPRPSGGDDRSSAQPPRRSR